MCSIEENNMNIINNFLKIAGKDNFKLDKRIPFVYTLRLCLKYGLMMIRGWLCSTGYSKISKSIFIGRSVKLYEKKYLSIGKKVKIHEGVKIDSLSTDGVFIGESVVLGHHTTIECTGSLQNIGKGLSIGKRTTFGNNCFFGAAGGIAIGEDVVAGQLIRFHSENHIYENRNILIREQGVSHKGIIVGSNCWIGSGAVFLDGSEIGDGSVVAANAVVTKKFPADSVIGGVPAKLLGSRGA